MRILNLKRYLIILGLCLGVTSAIHAQLTFPSFSNVTPSEIPQVFRGNFAWGDYNNDGRLDLIALGRSESWSHHGFLMNNTVTGNFKDVRDLKTMGFNVDDAYNTVFAWIDYNNDGNLDLLYMGTTGNETSSNPDDLFLYLYRNRGASGSYAFELVNNTGLQGLFPGQEGQYAGVIAIGDYDNDGYQDILVTGERDGQRLVSLYKNNKGDGTFTLQEGIVDGGNFAEVSNGGVVFADLNNDGYLDIIVNGWNNSVGTGYSAVYLNKGDGTFTKSTWTEDTSSSGQNQSGQTFVGDLNNDGYLDIVTSGERMDGSDWSTNTNVYFYQSHTTSNITYSEKTGSTIGISAVKKGGGDMADLNADGLLDFMIAGEGEGTSTSIYLNKGDETFERLYGTITGLRSGATLALADIDNDGYLDVTIMGGWAPMVQLWKNDGNLTKNTRPQAPTNLKAKYSAGKITFTWDAGSDVETPQGSLRYNLYLKSSDGKIMTVIPANISTGFLKVTDISGAINTTSYTLNVPRGNYEWGVQTIDQGKSGSEFATSNISGEGEVSIAYGKWEIVYDKDSRTLEYINNGNSILTGVFAKAKAGNTELKSSDYDTPTVEQEDITDDFGAGRKYTLLYTGSSSSQPDLKQVFYIYNDKDYFLTEAYIESANSTSSNYIAPIVTTTRSSFLPTNESNRVLTVPFDNDGFVRYGSYPLSTDSVSFEVTSIFNGSQRNGIVIGSVEHDVWKTGVRFSTSSNRYIDKLECFGGITHNLTRDINNNTKKGHGSISGKSLKSPKVLFGYFEDWRRGMEQYADANATIAPPRKWEKDTPFGWNSWSGMETHVNYEGVTDISDFIKNQLGPKGFDSNAVYIGLDSWWNENFTDQQLIDFVKHCKENGQEAGIYMTPFSDWWDGDEGANRVMEGTNGQYKYKDAYLYADGKPIKIESKALDPTHPGTKMLMKYNIDRFKSWGFKYIKLDFINNGTLEADSFYEDGITTGVQAYNHGMQYLVDLCGEEMFLALSIAPTFPTQYAHSKRISCDTWGQMSEHESHTGYMLNSLSFGWWLDRVYPFNDPDHLVLHDRESRNLYSEGANRARITSGVITGMYMLGDNLSLKGSYQGTQAIRDRDLQMAGNKDINAIAKTGRSFYPVEGYMANGYDRSENFFMLDEGNYIYLTVFNYKDNQALNGNIALSRLGISADLIKEVKELWTGSLVEITDNAVPYAVPSQDARVYRIEKEEEVATMPAITKQPEPAEVFVGDPVTFELEASGGFLDYQWYKDDTAIENATSRYLTINEAAMTDDGEYHCVVSNTEGTVSSNKVRLKVLTTDVKLDELLINNSVWDIEDIFAMDCGTNNVSIKITPQGATAKVVYQGAVVPDKTINLTINNPGVKEVPFSIVSANDENISKNYILKVERYFPFEQIVSVRWNNTLIANNNSSTNGGYKFSAYRWFKDGTEIGNNPSYSAGPRRDMLLDKDAYYHLQVMTDDGITLRTCASQVALISLGQMGVYPNPTSASESMTVDVDLNDSLMNDAVIEIYNINGLCVEQKKVEGRFNLVQSPQKPGVYLVKVKSKDFVQSQKIIVK